MFFFLIIIFNLSLISEIVPCHFIYWLSVAAHLWDILVYTVLHTCMVQFLKSWNGFRTAIACGQNMETILYFN